MERPSTPNSAAGEPRTGDWVTQSVEARFTEFCKNGLLMDDKFYEQAMKVLKETKHLLVANVSSIGAVGSQSEEAENYWFAFICYVVKRLGVKHNDKQQPSSDASGLSLSQILRTAKLNIVDFFKELTEFVVKAGPMLSNMYGGDWENNLEAKELQANFVHLSILSRLYKRSFKELFISSEVNGKQSTVDSEGVSLLSYHRFGWLLFLTLRIHVFSRFKDLVTCTNGLVSVLGILILHIPARFRNFSLKDSQWLVKRGDKGVDLIASLCNKYDTSEEELKKTMEKANDLIAEMLKKQPSEADKSECENLVGLDTDGIIYYDALMEEASLDSNLTILETNYEDATRTKSELDERVFINDEDSLLGSGSLSGGAVNITGTKRKLDMISSPSASPLSPFRSPVSQRNGHGSASKVIATPVSTAMSTAKWLRSVISLLPPRPSVKLQHFLASCEKDVTNDVMRRAEIILEAIFPTNSLGERCVTGSLQSTNLMDDLWAKQRKLEALKLYFRVLEAMCVAESQILHGSNLTSLLTNERFHRCMLACSAELVLATHKTVTLLFPTVLERTGITAFDLSKVIESFIRHEESLPRELRRHLNSLEERLLETMVWEKGSSMYNSLIVAKPALAAEIYRLGLLAEPMASLDSIAAHISFCPGTFPSLPSTQRHDNLSGQNGDTRSPKRQCTDFRSILVERNPFTSPVKDRVLSLSCLSSKLSPAPLQTAFASPTRPNPGSGGETFAETGINVFFTKISKLAAVRINGMAERLHQSHAHIRENVYRLFQQILSHQTSLFFNRHIDQIILCCFYGIAKISKVNLTFREIINNYRKQPQCKPQVFRCVYVDWSSTSQNSRSGQDHLEIITFYNEVFIPAAKPLLVEVGSAGVTTRPNQMSESSNKDGPCPASPRVSPFPSLPDMSPKKVSAVHNIYVSPLRTSKIDALISHSSKSYYACVGESTHAYQSPSKDLTEINNRLNGSVSGRKVRGALNFDDPDVGLVSDSMVASSLYTQNVSCASSSSGPTLKSEQLDT